MPHFARMTPPPIVTGDYRAFRSYVREDFSHRCAYCLLAELWAAGEENFELDHFRPKHLFPNQEKDFYNLYYACHVCNLNKRASWPPPDLEAMGVSFADLCKDEFATHFISTEDGAWNGVTESGRYTVDILRLNREQLVTVRLLLRRLGVDILNKATTQDALMGQLSQTAGSSPVL